MFDNIFFQIRDPLFKNSFYIILTSVLAAGFGFIFWIIAAKYYSASDVGTATALISSINLIVLLSLVGIDQSLIRFFPGRDKGEVFYTSLLIITLLTVIIGFIFIIGLEFWSPELTIIFQIIPSYFLILASVAVFSITSNAFIALRHADYLLNQNLLIGIRIIFLFPLVFLGPLGIFYSLGIAYILALLVPVYIITHFNLKYSGVSIEYVKESLDFSASNYLISLFSTVPVFLLPIMVLNMGGNEQTAIYYITYSISALLFIIPSAFGITIFVEGSHGQLSKKHLIKGFIWMLLILIPLIIIFLLFGKIILNLIGPDYVAGYGLLSILLLSSFGMVIFQLFSSIKKTQKRIKSLVIMCFFNCFLLIILSHFLYPIYGLSGIGAAWVISYSLIGAISIPYLLKEIKILP